MTYQTGTSGIEQALVQRERWPGRYDAKYTPLVYPGQNVSSDQPVLRLEYASSIEHTHGSHRPVPATEVVIAGLAGRVMKMTPRGGVVIEGRATVVRGGIGIGNQVAGVLTLWPPRGNTLSSLPSNALLVVPGPISFAFLHQAVTSGVSGVIASSIATCDLEGFLHTDIIQLLDFDDVEMAQMHLPPITLFLTEGLGTSAMPPQALNLLSHYQDTTALLSGVTSTCRAIFPELLIPLT